MPLTLGLMGFGRVGRSIFRILHGYNDIQLGAISDIADHRGLEYLVRYDTILGRFPHSLKYEDGHLYTGGRQIPMLSGRAPGDVDWAAHGVDIVIEATRQPRSEAELQRHIDKGAKGVICCVPPTDGDVPTIAMGVNQELMTKDMKIVSNASMTAHCAAPIAGVLHSAFEFERVFLSTVHAYSSDQSLADVPTKGNIRLSRAAAANIVPVATNAGETLEGLLPELSGKVSAMALKVPIDNGSLVDMVAFTKKKVTREAVNNVVESAANDVFPGIVEFARDPIVSSDVRMSPYSATFDSLATMAMGEHTIKTIAWYDNGWGYAHRAIELAARMADLGGISQ